MIRQTSRLPSLTGMRFIAAVLVFLTHVAAGKLFSDASLSGFLNDYLSRTGYLGVSFFFVLSGFILTWTARPDDTAARFYRRRLVKIYPNHFLTWLAGLLLMVWAGTAVTTGNTLPSMFLVQSWSPDFDVLMGTNGPSWSLACELLFYLSFPLLLPLLRKIPAARLWAAAAVVAAAVWLVPLISQLGPDSPVSPFQPVSWWKYWFTYFMPASRLFEFVMGIVMALIVQKGRWIGMRRTTAFLLLGVAYVLQVALPDSWGLVAPVVLPLGLAVAAGAVADTTGQRSVFATKTMVWLGEVSFAFYLVHILVFDYGPIGLATHPGAEHARATPVSIGLIVLTFGLSLLFGWLLYSFVERPMMRFSRPKKKPPAPEAVPVAAAPEGTGEPRR
ncbi:acyltransferase [Amycolatopsis sp. FU40]|uniref:acyltransferase family protein n=1 Tax=Amycolatopsis sp. FU40 TaxID=2914159 RepID=UPI001F1888A0|nr:acyltransferase [Amycolatopsis sp. FU40]UKD58630.1 acyltransferase [Amycolatopsis sp. FU40]